MLCQDGLHSPSALSSRSRNVDKSCLPDGKVGRLSDGRRAVAHGTSEFRLAMSQNLMGALPSVWGLNSSGTWRDRDSRESLDASYLVDLASSHMLVSKIKPCMSKYKPH